ncbi:MAG: NB-ARC domain-containing protein [Anaerolineae bacterium]
MSRFGELLTGAINSIAAYERKTALNIETELGGKIGLTAASIQRYKAGHVPPDARTIEVLASEAVRRAYLNQQWLERFLKAARYPAPQRLVEQLFPVSTQPSRALRIPHNLPAPSYPQFIMREREYRRVVEGLKQRTPTVVISGMGGTGKTSLAREVAGHCLEARDNFPSFAAAVWVSDKGRPGTTTLSGVLDEIARTLDHWDLTQLAHEEKKSQIEQVLRWQPVLIVIDNFETITDGSLLGWVMKLPPPSKALITTREKREEFLGSWLEDLGGMNEAEARELVAQRLRQLRMTNLVTEPSQLDPLIDATGANPQAMQMATGQLKYQRSLQQVIDDLHAARGQVFDDIFARSWSLIDKPAQHVLLVATFFPTSTAAEALAKAADVYDFGLEQAIELLTDLALLDVEQTGLDQPPRYGLHPLVRAFASERLREETTFELAARQRWCRYYVEFAEQHIVRTVPRTRYWNSLLGRDLTLANPEKSNLCSALEWAEVHHCDELLVELMIRWAHYMGRRNFRERIQFSKKAADAAARLGHQWDEAVLLIDAYGWVCIEAGLFEDAHHAISRGLELAYCIESADLIALGNAFLARLCIDTGGDLDRAGALLDTARLVVPNIGSDLEAVIRVRVDLASGDLAAKRGDYLKAIQCYEDALADGWHYGGEEPVVEAKFRLGQVFLVEGDVQRRLGEAALAQGEAAHAGGELEQAEIMLRRAEECFTQILDARHQSSLLDLTFAQYGLACVAVRRGDFARARTFASEAEGTLSQLGVSHALRGKVRQLLDDLEHMRSP